MTTEQQRFNVGDTPFNLSDELEDGTYVAQPRGEFDTTERILYIATAGTPPDDLEAWFQLTTAQTLRFSVGTGIVPVWFHRPPDQLPVGGTVRLAVGPSISTLSTDAPLPSPVVVSGITVTAADLAAYLRIDEERAGQLLEVAACVVAEYAPRAPSPVADEAVRRYAGYLREAPGGAIRSENVGPMSVDFQSSHAAMFRLCGAAGMLSRWKVRRAGAIG